MSIEEKSERVCARVHTLVLRGCIQMQTRKTDGAIFRLSCELIVVNQLEVPSGTVGWTWTVWWVFVCVCLNYTCDLWDAARTDDAWMMMVPIHDLLQLGKNVPVGLQREVCVTSFHELANRRRCCLFCCCGRRRPLNPRQKTYWHDLLPMETHRGLVDGILRY